MCIRDRRWSGPTSRTAASGCSTRTSPGWYRSSGCRWARPCRSSSDEEGHVPQVLPGWMHTYSGKVRDLYLPEPESPVAARHGDVVLVVASDRISAFDYVLPTLIPDKGRVLSQLTLWWFDQLDDLVGHPVSYTHLTL